MWKSPRCLIQFRISTMSKKKIAKIATKKKTTKKTAKKPAKKAAKKKTTKKAISKKTASKKTAKKTTKKAVKKATKKAASKKAAKKVTKKATKEAAKKTSGKASKKTSKSVSKAAPKPNLSGLSISDVLTVVAPSQPVEYKILSADNPVELSRLVNDLLYVQFDGTVWVPQGGICEEDDLYFQAMCRFE